MPKVQVGGRYYLGIDPGKSSGGATLLFANGQPCVCDGILESISFNKATEHEIGEWFKDKVRYVESVGGELKVALEKVHSMYGQSAQSGFSFGQNYGLLKGLLIALQVAFIEPTPQRWQKALGLIVKGRKSINDKSNEKKKFHQAKAHERWPKYVKQITHSVADSLLLAEFIRLEDRGGRL